MVQTIFSIIELLKQSIGAKFDNALTRLFFSYIDVKLSSLVLSISITSFILVRMPGLILFNSFAVLLETNISRS